jgi:hypothetical protein
MKMTYRKRRRTKNDNLGPIIDGDFLDADMMFMDAAGKELKHMLADKYSGGGMVHDAGGNLAGHRPGFVGFSAPLVTDESLHEASELAYQERNKHLNDAWRKDGTTNDDKRSSNLKDAQEAAALAYEQRNERLRNGWKREKTP